MPLIDDSPDVSLFPLPVLKTRSEPVPIQRPRPYGAVGVTLFVYAFSFFLPVDRSANGFMYFQIGAIYSATLILLPFTFPWLANVVLWAGLRLLWNRRNRAAARCGILATLLAAAYLLMCRNVGELDVGYWTWLASMFLMMAFAMSSDVNEPSDIGIIAYNEILDEDCDKFDKDLMRDRPPTGDARGELADAIFNRERTNASR